MTRPHRKSFSKSFELRKYRNYDQNRRSWWCHWTLIYYGHLFVLVVFMLLSVWQDGGWIGASIAVAFGWCIGLIIGEWHTTLRIALLQGTYILAMLQFSPWFQLIYFGINCMILRKMTGYDIPQDSSRMMVELLTFIIMLMTIQMLMLTAIGIGYLLQLLGWKPTRSIPSHHVRCGDE